VELILLWEVTSEFISSISPSGANFSSRYRPEARKGLHSFAEIPQQNTRAGNPARALALYGICTQCEIGFRSGPMRQRGHGVARKASRTRGRLSPKIREANPRESDTRAPLRRNLDLGKGAASRARFPCGDVKCSTLSFRLNLSFFAGTFLPVCFPEPESPKTAIERQGRSLLLCQSARHRRSSSP